MRAVIIYGLEGQGCLYNPIKQNQLLLGCFSITGSRNTRKHIFKELVLFCSHKCTEVIPICLLQVAHLKKKKCKDLWDEESFFYLRIPLPDKDIRHEINIDE